MRNLVVVLASAFLLSTSFTVNAEHFEKSEILASTEVVKTGSFVGTNGHVVSGDFRVVAVKGTHFVVLDDSFNLDEAPDPRFGFSKAGKFDNDSLFATVGFDSGAQIYRLPPTVDPKAYDELTLWCTQFSVPLAIGKFK